MRGGEKLRGNAVVVCGYILKDKVASISQTTGVVIISFIGAGQYNHRFVNSVGKIPIVIWCRLELEYTEKVQSKIRYVEFRYINR